MEFNWWTFGFQVVNVLVLLALLSFSVSYYIFVIAVFELVFTRYLLATAVLLTPFLGLAVQHILGRNAQVAGRILQFPAEKMHGEKRGDGVAWQADHRRIVNQSQYDWFSRFDRHAVDNDFTDFAKYGAGIILGSSRGAGVGEDDI